MVTLNKQFSGDGEILARVEHEIDFWVHREYFRLIDILRKIFP